MYQSIRELGTMNLEFAFRKVVGLRDSVHAVDFVPLFLFFFSFLSHFTEMNPCVSTASLVALLTTTLSHRISLFEK